MNQFEPFYPLIIKRINEYVARYAYFIVLSANFFKENKVWNNDNDLTVFYFISPSLDPAKFKNIHSVKLIDMNQ